MGTNLKPGTRLFGAACATEMIVVKAPAGEVELTIGGVPALLTADARKGDVELVAGHAEGSTLGKRYVDDAGEIELLCTKPGEGIAALAGEILQIKGAKPLPASD